ncbi:MAG: hypothetical protein INH34_17865 [Phycisphaerales bacterium]|nr:hypothetical protein [Phycisphaerales bacterium]
MKRTALERLLRERGQVKLFVATETYAVCGWVRDLRTDGDVAQVAVGDAVWLHFADGSVQTVATPSTLALAANASLTRRVQTHRRHLAGRHAPVAYWDAVARLGT